MKSKPLVSEKALSGMLQGAAEHWRRGAFNQYFEAMERAGRMAPRNHQVPMDVGAARLSLYEYPEARESFEQAVFLTPDKASALAAVALQCRNHNRYDLAEHYLERAAAQAGATADTLAKLAEMYERLRRLDKARDAVERALRLDPSGALALLVRARLERSAGDLAAGEATVRSFLGRTDADSWSTRIRGRAAATRCSRTA